MQPARKKPVQCSSTITAHGLEFTPAGSKLKILQKVAGRSHFCERSHLTLDAFYRRCLHRLLKIQIKKTNYQSSSVVDPDPDPHGSGTFCRIRIRNSRFRIRVTVQNWMEKCMKTIKK
jgi:predicted transcriptional regulator